MKKFVIIVAVLVLLQLVFVPATLAQGPYGGGNHGGYYGHPYQSHYGYNCHSYGSRYNYGYNYYYPGSRYYYSGCCYPRYQANYNCRPYYGYQNYGNCNYGYYPRYGNYY